jgi:hypothetical protein
MPYAITTVPVLCLFYRQMPTVMDRKEGREAPIFCWFVLVVMVGNALGKM